MENKEKRNYWQHELTYLAIDILLLLKDLSSGGVGSNSVALLVKQLSSVVSVQL